MNNQFIQNIGIEKTLIFGTSKSISTGATINLDSTLKYMGEVKKKITETFSLITSIEYANYKTPTSLSITGVDRHMNFLSTSLLTSWTFQNYFNLNFGAKKGNAYLFLMNGPIINATKGNLVDAVLDVSLRGVVFFGDVNLGYQYRYNISNDFGSTYGNVSPRGERIYANIDLLRSGRLGVSAHLDTFSASGNYDYLIISKALMGYFVLGW